MSKQGNETKLVLKARKVARAHYGKRLVDTKYHGSQFGESGVSDVLNCLDGIFVAVEFKAPESYGGSVERALEKGPTDKQRQYVRRVNEAGGIGGFAATVEQYMDLLLLAELLHEDRTL